MGPRQQPAVVEPGSAQHKRQLNTSATKFGNCAFLCVRRYLMAERQHIKVRIEKVVIDCCHHFAFSFIVFIVLRTWIPNTTTYVHTWIPNTTRYV